MEKRCRICRKRNCHRHCPGTLDGRHVPSRRYINVPEDAADDVGFIVDVQCTVCKFTGSVRVLWTSLQWE